MGVEAKIGEEEVDAAFVNELPAPLAKHSVGPSLGADLHPTRCTSAARLLACAPHGELLAHSDAVPVASHLHARLLPIVVPRLRFEERGKTADPDYAKYDVV
jgi:hypothetical protein